MYNNNKIRAGYLTIDRSHRRPERWKLTAVFVLLAIALTLALVFEANL